MLTRPNLEVRSHAHAAKLLFEGRKAVGIEYLRDGKPEQARASREIVVCSGVIDSPKLLMLSGIGPADQLKSHGIPVVADVAGVATTFQDHLKLSIRWNGKTELPGFDGDRGHVHALVAIGVRHAARLAVLCRPRASRRRTSSSPSPCRWSSRSRVARFGLRSADPLAAPIIRGNYLQEQADVNALVRGVHLARWFGEAEACTRRYAPTRSRRYLPQRATRIWPRLPVALLRCYLLIIRPVHAKWGRPPARLRWSTPIFACALQVHDGWASFTGVVDPGDELTTATVIIDDRDPDLPETTTVIVRLGTGVEFFAQLRGARSVTFRMTLRRFLLIIFLIGVAGISGELWLMGHYEDFYQQIPLVLCVLSLAALAAVLLRPGRGSVTLFRVVMACFILSGVIGAILHFQVNVEFQLEMDPACRA